MKKNIGFTLVEMVICIVLTGIVIFSIYSVVMSANKSYMKLHNSSSSKRDVLYLRNLLRKSIENANLSANFTTGTEHGYDYMQIGYYDNNFNGGSYRVDRYEFRYGDGFLEENEAISTNLTGITDLNLSNLKTADIVLTVYGGDSNPTSMFVKKSTDSHRIVQPEIVFRNVNKVYYYVKDQKKSSHDKFVESGVYMCILYSTEVDGNKEYHTEHFVFKNNNYYKKSFTIHTYVVQ